ncbi:hypothetical protein ACFE04_001170 [Oxalis oulophora]
MATLKFKITTQCLLLLLSATFLISNADQVKPLKIVFNLRESVQRGGDATQALMRAWKDGCASTTPSLIVAPIEVRVKGILKAPAELGPFNNSASWVTFNYIDHFTLSGKGTFDGRSLGEEPVTRISVRNCTLLGTMNGLRVKTWPSSPADSVVSDLRFEDIIMVNVSNPVLIEQEYCPSNLCDLQRPSRVKISNVSFKNIRGTSASQTAVKLVCSEMYPCQNVEMSDIDLTSIATQGPATSICTNVSPRHHPPYYASPLTYTPASPLTYTPPLANMVALDIPIADGGGKLHIVVAAEKVAACLLWQWFRFRFRLSAMIDEARCWMYLLLTAKDLDDVAKKKKYDFGCLIVSRKTFAWTVGALLLTGFIVGFVTITVKTMPKHKGLVSPPDKNI